MIQPRNNRVLVKPIDTEQSVGQIYIPECAQSKTRIGKVLAVGPGRWVEGVFVKTAVKKGDLVLFPGIAAEQPDAVFEDGSILIQDEDIGGILDRLPDSQYKPPLEYA